VREATGRDCRSNKKRCEEQLEEVREAIKKNEKKQKDGP
jgi:hypothetical protein